MGIDFTVFKGSSNGDVVQAKGHRDLKPTEVAIKISHCGVCGTDEHFRHADQGLGHEGVGTITEVGSMVPTLSEFRVGDRVGMSWFQKVCGYCDGCVSGHQQQCVNRIEFGTGNHDQGCFGTAVAWDISCLYKVPDEIESEYAGPLMCGGATVWSPLRDFGVKAGARVGVLGVGGLGHLAIQFASKMGMEVVVFSGTESKRQQALGLGASEFYVSGGPGSLDKVKEIEVLLVTASMLPDMKVYLPVMAFGALLFPLTVSTEILQVSPMDLIGKSLTVVGTGTASTASMRAMLRFAAKQGVRPIIEKYPMTLEGVQEAMARLREGKVRYRGVLVAP
ncbi:NADP-dependent alcohol dehydrogenase C 2 [Rhypophila decipiens]|uniref:NADP-dependent alcohol dehydrogenase C 2 n=1 Tax=Rhypophila decipiens TaxID=261697 RepID=A0AAN6XXQ7_9PEZI|nr:NADP-dependent alcohol dehydrogenase C 2 [Rhypophila decipiens]